MCLLLVWRVCDQAFGTRERCRKVVTSPTGKLKICTLTPVEWKKRSAGCSKVRTPPVRPPHTHKHTHRQDRLQYTAPLASAQCKNSLILKMLVFSIYNEKQRRYHGKTVLKQWCQGACERLAVLNWRLASIHPSSFALISIPSVLWNCCLAGMAIVNSLFQQSQSVSVEDISGTLPNMGWSREQKAELNKTKATATIIVLLQLGASWNFMHVNYLLSFSANSGHN